MTGFVVQGHIYAFSQWEQPASSVMLKFLICIFYSWTATFAWSEVETPG